MPVTQLRRSAPSVLSAVLLFALPGAAGPQPSQPPEPAKARPGIDAEVRCADESVIRLKLIDEKLELATKYGVFQIPVADVRRIEFAPRIPPEVAEKVVVAISKLGHPDFKVREAATEELKGYRERAYPYLLKVLKHEDPEVSRRADEVVKFIQGKVSSALLDPRDTDVVQTDDSRITGRFTAESLRVGTSQFGDQQLKLSEIRTLRTGAGLNADELANAPAAPANMTAYQNQFGKEYVFTVTGFNPSPGASPGLWGTDVYTLDSSVAAAVVHAGFAKPGETIAVRVRIVHSPQQFVSTTRHGISSTAYGNYPTGAFEFMRR